MPHPARIEARLPDLCGERESLRIRAEQGVKHTDVPGRAPKGKVNGWRRGKGEYGREKPPMSLGGRMGETEEEQDLTNLYIPGWGLGTREYKGKRDNLRVTGNVYRIEKRGIGRAKERGVWESGKKERPLHSNGRNSPGGVLA